MVVNGWGMGKGSWFQNIPASHRLFLFCLNPKHQISVKIWKTKVQMGEFYRCCAKGWGRCKKTAATPLGCRRRFF
jgi:hypothetical protein